MRKPISKTSHHYLLYLIKKLTNFHLLFSFATKLHPMYPIKEKDLNYLLIKKLPHTLAHSS